MEIAIGFVFVAAITALVKFRAIPKVGDWLLRKQEERDAR